MDEATVRAMLEQHFTSSDPHRSHEMYLGVSILEFRSDRIARETIYVTEGWEAPEWRAQWRSAP